MKYNHFTNNGQHYSSGIGEQHRGTISKHLAELARDLWMRYLQRDIYMVAQHLPEEMNLIADSESRVLVNQTDWMINPSISV